MNEIGCYLKNQRTSLSLSLNSVCEKTGITATRLNRIERGEVKEPSPQALKELSELYKLDLLYLYQLAGYIEQDKLPEKMCPLKNYDCLNEEELLFVQNTIDFLLKKHAE